VETCAANFTEVAQAGRFAGEGGWKGLRHSQEEEDGQFSETV
jgi:hypothetical protein